MNNNKFFFVNTTSVDNKILVTIFLKIVNYWNNNKIKNKISAGNNALKFEKVTRQLGLFVNYNSH